MLPTQTNAGGFCALKALLGWLAFCCLTLGVNVWNLWLKHLSEQIMGMTIRIQFWWFPVLFWNHQSQKGILWSAQVFLVDCINNEVRVSPLWKTRKGKGRFMGSRFHAICKMDLTRAKPSAESSPHTLCEQKQHLSSDTRNCCGAWKPSGFLSCLPKLWLMQWKSPPQNQNTMLLSAHKHTNLKRVGTNCLQNPESFGFSSYSQTLLEFTASFVIIFIIIIIIISESTLWEHRNYSSCTANTSKHIYLFL